MSKYTFVFLFVVLLHSSAIAEPEACAPDVITKKQFSKGNPIIVLSTAEPRRFTRIFTLYEDGTAIYCFGQQQGPSGYIPYRFCKLSQKDIDFLVSDFSKFQSGNYVLNTSRNFFLFVKGGKGRKAKEITINSPKALANSPPLPDDIEVGLLQLATFHREESKPYIASRVLLEMRLADTQETQRAIDWPSAWPKPIREPGDEFLSVNLPLSQYREFCGLENNFYLFHMNQKYYSVIVQYLFPDELHKAIGSRPFVDSRVLRSVDKNSGSGTPSVAAKSLLLIQSSRERRKRNDIAGAIADLTSAIGMMPCTNPDLYKERATLKEEQKDLFGAIADYSIAIEWLERYKSTSHLIRDLTEAYLLRATCKSSNKDSEGAIADCNKALSLDSAYASAFTLRAKLREAKKDYDGALADFTQSIKCDPSASITFCRRGFLRLSLDDTNGVLKDFDKAISLHKSYSEAYYGRALAQLKLSKFQGAVSDCNSAIEFSPGFDSAYICLGGILLRIGEYSKAIDIYSSALDRFPKSARLFYERGLARSYIHDFEGALKDSEEAMRLDPAYPGAEYLVKRAKLSINHDAK
ncbi:MAG: tetratricopeptide repeat protein [Candidatus Obscuribacterales bacterium]|nr:tetratricopeptide repeat protein [Candidatus Obscuribacterales bacterium]